MTELPVRINNIAKFIVSFPDDPDLRKKWIEATGRKDWTPTKYSKICSNHFPENLLIKKKKKTVLHSDAVQNAIQVVVSDNSTISKSASVSLLQEPEKSIKISTPEESADPVPTTSSSANFQDHSKIKTIRRKLHLPEEEDTPRKKKLKADLKKKTEAVANLTKKIRAVRQTNRRLMKRFDEQSPKKR